MRGIAGQVYKRYFVDIEKELTEEMWDDKVRQCRDDGVVEIVPGFSLVCSRDGRVSVRANRRRNEEMEGVFQQVNALHDSFIRSLATHGLSSAMRKDGTGIQQMVSSMLSSSDAFRYGLIISDNTKNTREQDLLVSELQRMYCDFDSGLALVKWDCKNIKVTFTAQALVQRSSLLDDVNAELARLGVVVKSTDASGGVDAPPSIAIEKDPRISLVLEALKEMCSRVLIITGEIGGRGVPYHSLDNLRILTDMFTGQNVPDATEVTAHGEYLIQLAGRLNTIHTLLDNPPVIRLWASESVHRLHMHHLSDVDAVVKLVQQHRSYEEAYKRMPRFIAGRKLNGDRTLIPASRGRFRRDEARMRQAGERDADLPRKRTREFDMDDYDRYLPAETAERCFARVQPPIADAGNNADHSPFEWTPELGAWDEERHNKWELGLTGEHVEAGGRRFKDWMGRDDVVHWEQAENGDGYVNCYFKSLKALQQFFVDGGAGPREQALMRVHLRAAADLRAAAAAADSV